MSYYVNPGQLWLSPLPPQPATTPAFRPQMPAVDLAMPVDIWARTYLDFHADPVQSQILNTHTHRLAVCCSRQWGKSSVAAVKALHLAWRQPGALILFASKTFDQSAELLRIFRQMATRLTGAPCKGEPGRKGSIVLPNHSRILALPQSPQTIRCYSAPDLIVVDEAAFVIDELYEALSPMLAVSDGQLWLLSTPNGQSGEFHKIWHSKTQQWHRFSVSADQCPRITPAFLERERLAKGEHVFLQEYMCRFVLGRKQVIELKWIQDAFRGNYPAMEFPP